MKVDPGYKCFMSEWWKISKISIPDITDRVNKKETTMYVAYNSKIENVPTSDVNKYKVQLHT